MQNSLYLLCFLQLQRLESLEKVAFPVVPLAACRRWLEAKAAIFEVKFGLFPKHYLSVFQKKLR